MKGLFFLGVGLCFWSLNVLPAQARDDWQFWHGVTVKTQVMDDWQLRLAGEQRVRDDFSDAFFGRVDAVFLYQPSQYLEIGPAYRYQRFKNSKSKHTNENQYYLEATLKYRYQRIRLADRSRLVFRDKNTRDSWLYRNRLKVSYDIPVRAIRISPFVFDEVFFDTGPGQWTQNRLGLGMDLQLSKRIDLQFFYILRSDRPSNPRQWEETQVLGTHVTLIL